MERPNKHHIREEMRKVRQALVRCNSMISEIETYIMSFPDE